MKPFLRWVSGATIVLITAIEAINAATRGYYLVAHVVTDDRSLPSETVAGAQLHMRMVNGPEGAATLVVLHGARALRRLFRVEFVKACYRKNFPGLRTDPRWQTAIIAAFHCGALNRQLPVPTIAAQTGLETNRPQSPPI